MTFVPGCTNIADADSQQQVGRVLVVAVRGGDTGGHPPDYEGDPGPASDAE